jgi:hypothetical protein
MNQTDSLRFGDLEREAGMGRRTEIDFFEVLEF